MKKFYPISAIINLILSLLVFELVDLIIYLFVVLSENSLSNSQFSLISKLGIISDISLTLIFYKIIFWWIVPFSILVLKKYKYHWLFFLIIIFILSITTIPSKEKSFEVYIYEISYFGSIGIITSILIHYSQMILGKKLLPTMYKRH